MNAVVDTQAKVWEIRRRTRKTFSAEEKFRMVLEGLKGEASIAEICRWEGVNPNLYYSWSKEFLEAGTSRQELRNIYVDRILLVVPAA